MNVRRIFEKIIENWPAKVLAVVLAIILSVFHQISTLVEDSFSIPIKIENSGYLVPAKPYQKIVRVTLRSDEKNINSVDRADIEVYVDLLKITEPGSYKMPVLVRKTGTAVGVDPLEININPAEIEIDLEYKMTKYVPVTPNFRGYLESGYEMVSYTLDPSQVEIEGPQSIITSVTGLSTDYIELTGRKSNFVTTSRILSTDPLMVVRGSGVVEFRGSIQELIMIRNFEQLPISVIGLNSRFAAKLSITQGAVRIEGSQNALENYTPMGSVLSIDCSNIEHTGTVTLPVAVAVPLQFELIRYEPMEVTVTIEPNHGDTRE